jgi:hypothetical protein
MVDLQSPMDIAALIWEKRGFYAALVEDPPAVRELARRVRGLLTAFLDEWRARYGEACIAHYPDYYLPRGISLSEDEIGAVSPRVFEELFLPELEELSGRYGGIGIHCCAHARHQWEGLKRIPGLMLLNLVQPESVLREAYGCFARRVPQMHAWCGEGDPAGWPARMPTGSRIVFQVNAGSRERAVEAARAMRASLDG